MGKLSSTMRDELHAQACVQQHFVQVEMQERLQLLISPLVHNPKVSGNSSSNFFSYNMGLMAA